MKQDIDMDMNYLLSSQFSYFSCVKDDKIIGMVIISEMKHINIIYDCFFEHYDDLKIMEENRSSAKIGVEVIWIHQQFKKRKIASHLIDCSRFFLHYGTVYEKSEMAVTQPTQEGFSFFKKYFDGKIKIFLPTI